MTIARRLYLVLGIMVLLISAELSALWFTIHTLSAVRASVAAEGIWSKAEKDAAYHLEAYGRTRDPREYRAYQGQLNVYLGDLQANVELAKENPDQNLMYQGFARGGIDREDIPGVIALFLHFGKVGYVARALSAWTAASEEMAQFVRLGTQLHAQVQSGSSSIVVGRTLTQIAAVNAELTVLEGRFSETLGQGSRWLTGLVLKVLLGAALVVELSGLFFTAAITRGISLRLRAMLHAAERVSNGDFSVTLDEHRKDEIGLLAAAFNAMTRDLERERRRAEAAVLASEESLREAQRVAHIGSWEWTFASDLMACSKEVCRLHGLAADVAGLSFARFLRHVYPEDVQKVDQIFRGARHSGEPFVLDYRVALKVEDRWLCAEARVEREPDGRLVRMLGTTRDITERKRLEVLAQTDPLTKLPNRPVLVERLGRAIDDAAADGGVAAVLFLDLDKFKGVNDASGHSAGDYLLVAVAERLTSLLRSGDTVARCGGDEFLIALREPAGIEAVERFAKSVREAMARPFVVYNEVLSITASIGVSAFPQDGDDAETLIRAADWAVYQAKEDGRNTVRFHSPVVAEFDVHSSA